MRNVGTMLVALLSACAPRGVAAPASVEVTDELPDGGVSEEPHSEPYGGHETGEPDEPPVDEVEEFGAVRGCPQLFEEALRGQWHRVTGEDYYIDAFGRPEAARTIVPPYREDSRIESCQREVGHWGNAEDPSIVYHGGHLIGFQLGGWGARANLVPQVGGFNTGNWLQLENALEDCADDLEPGRLTVEVRVTYGEGFALIPETMRMHILDTLEPARDVDVQFDNAPRGGPDGTSERERGVAWLRAIGCARD